MKSTSRELARAQADMLRSQEFLHRDDKNIKPLLDKRGALEKEMREAQQKVQERMAKLKEDPELLDLQYTAQQVQVKRLDVMNKLRKALQKFMPAELLDPEE